MDGDRTKQAIKFVEENYFMFQGCEVGKEKGLTDYIIRTLKKVANNQLMGGNNDGKKNNK